MIIAIVCGLLSGVVGFLPLLVGLNMTKKVTSTSNFGHMSILILSLVVSFVVMFALAVLCVVLRATTRCPSCSPRQWPFRSSPSPSAS